MSELRSVPKPDGFELRDARASKEDDGRKWLPCDALFDASEALKVNPPEVAFLVAWYIRLPSGNLGLKYRISYEHERQGTALAADLLAEMSAQS